LRRLLPLKSKGLTLARLMIRNPLLVSIEKRMKV
jgi:hypothetical protein